MVSMTETFEVEMTLNLENDPSLLQSAEERNRNVALYSIKLHLQLHF